MKFNNPYETLLHEPRLCNFFAAENIESCSDEHEDLRKMYWLQSTPWEEIKTEALKRGLPTNRRKVLWLGWMSFLTCGTCNQEGMIFKSRQTLMEAWYSQREGGLYTRCPPCIFCGHSRRHDCTCLRCTGSQDKDEEVPTESVAQEDPEEPAASVSELHQLCTDCRSLWSEIDCGHCSLTEDGMKEFHSAVSEFGTEMILKYARVARERVYAKESPQQCIAMFSYLMGIVRTWREGSRYVVRNQ